MKTFIVMLMLVIIWALVVSYYFGRTFKKEKEEYLKPDTTITIRNSKPDTVITMRSIPWYLR